MRRLPALALVIVSGIAGGAAGLLLRPGENPSSEVPAVTLSAADTEDKGPQDAAAHDFAKLNNQFVIPVVKQGRIASLVILSLSLEVSPGARDKVFAAEPKLRDAFLTVLFDHANSGGFEGSFTEADALRPLRKALLETAQKLLGPTVSDVLIGDIVRQDN